MIRVILPYFCLTKRYNNHPKSSKGSHTDITLGSHPIVVSGIEHSKREVYHINNILQVLSPLQPPLGHHGKTPQASWNPLHLHLKETEMITAVQPSLCSPVCWLPQDDAPPLSVASPPLPTTVDLFLPQGRH